MIALKAYHEMAGTLGWASGSVPTTSVTINNSNGANTSGGALPPADANANIQKLLELTEPKEDG